MKYLINAPTRSVARSFIAKAKEQGITGLCTPFRTPYGYWTTQFKRPVLSLNK